MIRKKILIFALLSITTIKPKSIPFGGNIRGSVYIPLDDDALEFVASSQFGSTSYLQDLVFAIAFGIRFYDEDLSAVGTLSIPLLGNKLKMNGRDYLRHIALNGHVVWELADFPNLMVGPQFSISLSSIQIGVTISQKFQRYEIGGSLYVIKQLEFLKPKIESKNNEKKPIASIPINLVNHNYYGNHSLFQENHGNLSEIYKQYLTQKQYEQNPNLSAEQIDQIVIEKMKNKGNVLKNLETILNLNLKKIIQPEKDTLKEYYTRITGYFMHNLKQKKALNFYENAPENLKQNIKLQLALKAYADSFNATIEDFIELIKIENILIDDNNEMCQNILEILQECEIFQKEKINKIITDPSFLDSKEERLENEDFYRQYYPATRKQNLNGIICNQLNFQRLIKEIWEKNPKNLKEEICNMVLIILKENPKKGQPLLNENETRDYIFDYIEHLEQTSKDPQYESIKNWILKKHKITYKEAQEELGAISEKTFYFALALYKTDVEKIIENILIGTNHKDFDLVEDVKEEIVEQIKNDLDHILAKNVAHNLVNISNDKNFDPLENLEQILPILRNALYYYANGFLIDQQHIEDRIIRQNINSEINLEENAMQITKKINAAHPNYQIYDKTDVENILKIKLVNNDINAHRSKSTSNTKNDEVEAESEIGEEQSLSELELENKGDYLHPDDASEYSSEEGMTNSDFESETYSNADINESIDSDLIQNVYTTDNLINTQEENINQTEIMHQPVEKEEIQDTNEIIEDVSEEATDTDTDTDTETTSKENINQELLSENNQKATKIKKIKTSKKAKKPSENPSLEIDTNNQNPAIIPAEKKTKSEKKQHERINQDPAITQDVINQLNCIEANAETLLKENKKNQEKINQQKTEQAKLNINLQADTLGDIVRKLKQIPDADKSAIEILKIQNAAMSQIEKQRKDIDLELKDKDSDVSKQALASLNSINTTNPEAIYKNAQNLSQQQRMLADRLIAQKNEETNKTLLELTNGNNGKEIKVRKTKGLTQGALKMDLTDKHTKEVFDVLNKQEKLDKIQQDIRRADIDEATKNLKGPEKQRMKKDLYTAQAMLDAKEHLNIRKEQIIQNAAARQEELNKENAGKSAKRQKSKLSHGEKQSNSKIPSYMKATQGSINREDESQIAATQKRREIDLMRNANQIGKRQGITSSAAPRTSRTGTGFSVVRGRNATNTTGTLVSNTKNATKNRNKSKTTTTKKL